MRAQTTIETLVLLAFGLIFLLVITQIIFSNLDVYYGIQQDQIGTQSLSILANEIDDVYFMGPGSTKLITIMLPENMDLDNSYISGKDLVMRLGGTDHIKETRVKVVGVWPGKSGKYTFRLIAYGDFVAISTDLLEFNPNNIAVSLHQGSSTTLDLNIQNLSTSSANYTFSINFSHAGATLTSTDVGVVSFLGEDYNLVSLNFNCARTAVGNYDGTLSFNGDNNSSVPVKLYCEAGQSRLSVYPSSSDFNQTEFTTGSQTFQVCNSSNINYSSSSSSISGEISPYVFTSFSGDINANTCRTLSLTVTPGAVGDQNIYLGTLTVTSAGFTASNDLNLLIIPGPVFYNWFASVENSNLNHEFDYVGFVKQRASDNAWVATGELDWNSDNDAILLLSDAFDGASLDAGTWGTQLDDVLNYVTESGGEVRIGGPFEADNWNGAHMYSQDSFTLSDGIDLSVKWRPHNYHLNTAAQSSIKFVKPDAARETSYEHRNEQFLGIMFDNINWTTVIDNFYITDAGTSAGSYQGTTRATLSASPVMEGWNDLRIKVNPDDRVVKVWLNGDYLGSGTFNETNWNSLGDEYVVEFSYANYDRTEYDGYKDLYINNYSEIDENLIAYYKFNDTNGGTGIYDSAGEHNGTLMGTANVGEYGMWDSNALELTVDGDYVTLGDVTNLAPTNLTLSFWAKVNNPATSFNGGIAKGVIFGSGSQFMYRIDFHEGNTYFDITDTSNVSHGPSTPIGDSDWHMWTLTYDGVNVVGYKDGLSVGSEESANIDTVKSYNGFSLGARYTNNVGQYALDGLIDEVKIYDRALTADEILADYNSFLSAKFVDDAVVDAGSSADWDAVKINSDVNINFGNEMCGSVDTSCNVEQWNTGLVGLWHLNEVSGNAVDSSGNENTGTVTNAVPAASGLWGTTSYDFTNATARIATSGAILSASDASAPHTISVWAKLDSSGTSGGIITQYASGSSTNRFGFRVNASNKLAWWKGGSYLANATSVITDDVWHHLVGVKDSSQNISLYVDGVLEGTGSDAKVFEDTAMEIGIFSSGTAPTSGLIEEVAIWDKALSAIEVRDLYRKGVSSLDLNIYSCSDVLCATKGTPQLITDANNNSWMTIPSGVSNSQYLGYEIIFGKATGFSDYDAGNFYVGSYLQDVNISYSS